jgi:hypothetical protein
MVWVEKEGHDVAVPMLPSSIPPETRFKVPVEVNWKPASLKMELGTELPIVKLLAAPIVRIELSDTPLAFSILTPPVPENVPGNSIPVVCAAEPRYSNVADAPKVGVVPDAVAVPCKESVPLIVVATGKFLAPEPEKVRLP